MRKYRKIYETPNRNYVCLEMQLGGIKTNIEFRNGRVANNINAQFITSNRFLQEMIENDKRFGSMIICKQVIDLGDFGEDEEAKPAPAPAPTPKKTSKKVSGKTVVEEVRDITDAIDWLSKNGKVATTPAQVQKAAAELGVEFPNLH